MRGFFRHVAASAAAGWVAGGVVGSVEFLNLARSLFPARGDLVPVLFGYSIYWCAGALVLGVVRGAFARKRAPRFAKLFLEYAGFTVAGGVFSYLVYKANAYWCPSPLATSSIAVNSALVMAGIVSLWVIHRLERPLRARAGWWVAAGLSVAWLSAAAASLYPAREAAEAARGAATAGKRPNVLVLCVDTLRADHLGCYGYARPTSPAIDAVAREGVLFKHCVAASSWTRPSVTSILTGVLPPTHGQYHPESALPEGAPMMPDAMGPHGYRTALISANFVICKNSGFAQSVDLYGGPSFPPVFYTSLDYCLGHANRLYVKLIPRSDKPWYHRMFFDKVFRWLSDARRPEKDRAERDAAWANRTLLEWIDRDKGRPFFAFVLYMEPHTPYEAPPPYDTMFTDPAYRGPERTGAPLPPGMETPLPPLARGVELPDDERRFLEGRYDGEIRSLDDRLAELFAALKERGLYDETLIVVCADHGEEFFEHGSWYHRHSLYNEIVHVPLVLKLPHSSPAGVVVDGAVRQIDILPTILDLTRLPPWRGIEGSSLASLIRGEVAGFRGMPALSDMYCQGNYVSALEEGTMKLIHIKARKEAWFLYDVAVDPGETKPLNAEAPEVLSRMRDTMETMLSQYRGRPWSSETRELSGEELKNLKTLGYVQP